MLLYHKNAVFNLKKLKPGSIGNSIYYNLYSGIDER